MNELYASLLRRFTSNGLRKGLAGSRPWLILGIVAAGARMIRHIARDEHDVLYRTAIRSGDVFEIVTRPPK